MEKVEKNRLVKTFLVRAVVIFVVWKVIYHGFIKLEGTVDGYLTELVVEATLMVLNLIGFESNSVSNIIYINGVQSVLIADACNALELIVLFVGFLVCFPGDLSSKLVYSLVGTIAILSINVIREVALALNYNYFRSTFDLNHKYTYALVVYFVVFLIWKHWVERFSVFGRYKKGEEN